MPSLLLAVTLILWSLTLLGLVAISNVVLGIFALITGILFLIASFGVGLPVLPSARRNP